MRCELVLNKSDLQKIIIEYLNNKVDAKITNFDLVFLGQSGYGGKTEMKELIDIRVKVEKYI